MAQKIPVPRKPSFSPEKVAADITADGDANRAFAQLDLGQCQFHETVDTAGYSGPAIPMQGFGGVAKGKLALSPETVNAYQQSEITPITAITGHTIKDYYPARNSIFDTSRSSEMLFIRPNHFAVGMETAGMTWLRNPALTHDVVAKTISINGITLHEGDMVTMDARTGKIYSADLPIKPVPPPTTSLDSAAKKLLPQFQVLASTLDDPSISSATLSSAEGIGLFRSEDMLREKLVLMGNGYCDWEGKGGDDIDEMQRCTFARRIYSKTQMQEMFKDLLENSEKTQELQDELKRRLDGSIELGIIRTYHFTNQDRSIPHNTFPFTYRLTDPDVFREEIEETQPFSAEQKKCFYGLQADAIFNCMVTRRMQDKMPLSVLVPSVKSAEELAEIKAEVDKAAKAHGYMDAEGKRRYKFGAMMETKEAVKPKEAAKIAKLCDFVSFGTNDLTAAITGLKRDDLDAAHQQACKRWMADHGCQDMGNSPYDVLVPLVTRTMGFAIKAMRKENPDIQIGCCGRQVAANAPSIQACMKMGLDNICVPPQDVAPSRIIAAHYAARQAVGLERARII